MRNFTVATVKINYFFAVVTVNIYDSYPDMSIVYTSSSLLIIDHAKADLKIDNEVTNPMKGDFIVNDKYLFEVGGKNKKFDQIADIQDSFLAVDDTEVGYGNRIPLWLFGFLY